MTRRQSGRIGRFTAAEIERIRKVHNAWIAARNERIRLCKEMSLRSDMFCRIGRGHVGKKPRAAS